jgi:hypothetical protein
LIQQDGRQLIFNHQLVQTIMACIWNGREQQHVFLILLVSALEGAMLDHAPKPPRSDRETGHVFREELFGIRKLKHDGFFRGRGGVIGTAVLWPVFSYSASFSLLASCCRLGSAM